MVRRCPCPVCGIRRQVEITVGARFSCECGFATEIGGLAMPRDYLTSFAQLEVARARACVIDQVDALLLEWVATTRAGSPLGPELRHVCTRNAKLARARIASRQSVERCLDQTRGLIAETRSLLAASASSIEESRAMRGA